MLVNPVDYFRRVLPATRMLTPDGIYASVLPVDAEIIQSAAVPEGKAVYGMATKYFLGVGMAKNGKIEYSDEYRFLEDERVYLIKLYALVSHWITMLSRFWISRISSRYVLRL